MAGAVVPWAVFFAISLLESTSTPRPAMLNETAGSLERFLYFFEGRAVGFCVNLGLHCAIAEALPRFFHKGRALEELLSAGQVFSLIATRLPEIDWSDLVVSIV